MDEIMPTRYFYTVHSLIAFFILAISVYLQVFEGFIPCPLCSLQRFVFGLLGLVFFIGIFTFRKKIINLIVKILGVFISFSGILLAGRQVWLQHFPPVHNECGVSLRYIVNALPIQDAVTKIFEGSAECTQR